MGTALSPREPLLLIQRPINQTLIPRSPAFPGPPVTGDFFTPVAPRKIRFQVPLFILPVTNHSCRSAETN
jgi:hypothetical protein